MITLSVFFPSHTTTQAVLASGGSIYIKYELFHIGGCKKSPEEKRDLS